MLKIDCELPFEPAKLSLWREALWAGEWFKLRSSDVYAGRGVPHGRGEPVVLVPGFLSTDRSLEELHHWLERIGYRVFGSGIGRNDDCPDVLLAKLLEAVDAASDAAGGPVRMVGHSLGGTLARAAAVRRPDLVGQVVCLGSPVAGSGVNPVLLRLARLVSAVKPVPSQVPRAHEGHYHDGTCVCDLSETLAEEISSGIPLASISSRTDGVVEWESSQLPPPGINVEVKASHIGLTVNTEVYRSLAWLLAQRRPDDRGYWTDEA